MHFYSWRGALVLLCTLWAALGRAQSSGDWTSVDVGDVGAAGSSSESGGVVSLQGSGADVGGTLDEFHFRSIAWNGDGMFVARVTSLASVDNWAKLGVMVRADLTAGAPTFFACVNPAKIAALVARTAAGAAATLGSASEDRYRAMPMWVKLVRDGDEFMMQFSPDGVNWTARFAQTTIALPAAVRAGLAITSKADGRLATGTVDSVRFGPIVPTNLLAIARGATQVELRWLDNALRETGFEVERSTDNASFTRIGTREANASIAGTDTRFVDATAAASTAYWYRVRSVGPGGPSPYSAAVAVTTPPPPPPGWATTDVGDTLVGGSLTEAGGVFSLAGAGRGVAGINTTMTISDNRGDREVPVYGGEDQFYLAAQPWTGDGEFVARIAGLRGPARSQAGLVVRSTAAANSPGVFAGLRADGSSTVLVRAALIPSFGRTDNTSREWPLAPPGGTTALWVKLVRAGNAVMVYSSADDAAWQESAFVKVALAHDLLAGFGIASSDSSVRATATIERVAFGPVATDITPLPPAELAVTRVGASDVSLAWKNQTALALVDTVTVERSTDGATFTAVSTYPLESFVDDKLSPATTYYYRVRAGRGNFYSPYSNVVRATTPPLSPTGRPTIAVQPKSQAAASGSAVTLEAGSPSGTASYQWFRDGVSQTAATASGRFTINAVNETHAGIYTCLISDAGASIETTPAILGLMLAAKTNAGGTEVAANIVHPNGNVYDQILATSDVPAITADAGQVTRISFLDLNDDIVQVEFSGAGTLLLHFDAFVAAAPPSLYNQPDVRYVKGHAGIVIAGADATTNVSIFTVGRKTAVNQALFRADAAYDGIADLAYLAIISADGKFGGVRAANANFWATRGLTGVYAPGVAFAGPVYVGDIGARDTALPMLLTGTVADLRIAGGDLLQANGQAVQIGAVTRVQFTAGEDAHGRPLAVKTNQARLLRDGQDVTADVVVYP